MSDLLDLDEIALVEKAITILERLIAFDTESSKSNLALMDYVRSFLSERGIPFITTPNEDGSKLALFATLGPMRDGGVVLSGHSDVVPVKGQIWTSDPFALRRENGRLYGRGSCDMKGFVALVLALCDHCAHENFTRPLHFLLSYDEETTCLGPLDIIRKWGVDLPVPAAAIVGEPTLMAVADTQKAITTYRTEVVGHEAHSSLPALGVNAIEIACDLVSFLYQHAKDMTSAIGDERFTPAVATLSVGRIEGGTARNILARHCSFLWEVRSLPQQDPFVIERALNDYVTKILLPHHTKGVGKAIISTQREVHVPALVPQAGSWAEQLALKYAQSNHCIAVSYATEAGQFQSAGVPTVICGPGSIAQAHQPDEYIEIDQLRAGMRFLHRLARDMTNQP
jgi:acetylornithine deacetylase